MPPFLSYRRAKVCFVSLALTLAACTERAEAPDELGWSETCIDLDQDGFGFHCERGPDCDDDDAALNTECACKRPNEGCACEPGTAAVECTLPYQVGDDGVLYCHQGTRSCRDGSWSECESVAQFEVPAAAALAYEQYLEKRADRAYLLDLDPTQCSPCRPDCYLVEDPLDGADGGVVTSGTTFVPGGGITLDSHPLDASADAAPPVTELPEECTPGTAPDFDCDGIPDDYDPYPSEPPFATDHSTIFMDLAPGDTGTKSFEVRFYVNTADIYFLVDLTGSMQDERDKLKDSLTVGNFLDDPSTTTVDESASVECADRDFDGSADNALKGKGIAGNIACLIRDANLGAGWFREIPFQGPYQNPSEITVGYYDQELFQNEQDLTGEVNRVLSAIDRFQVRGNYNWAEGGMQALHALVTGEELYTGWDRPGVPRRLDCPAGTWGYPCFRDDAVPIVIFITDAPLMNGPATAAGHLGPWDANSDGVNNPIDYDQGVLDDLKAGTDATYHQLGTAHESIASARDVGTINGALTTYTGSTLGMTADVTYADVGACPSGSSAWHATQQGAPDAVFAFRVDEAEELTVSTRGSRFDTALAIIPAGMTPVPPSPLSISGVSGNTGPTNPRDLGTLPDNVSLVVTGNSTGVETNYTRDGLGCMVGTSADYTEDAATFRFRVAEDMRARITATGSSFDLATSLYAGDAPDVRESVNLGAISCAGGGTNNCNDTVGDYDFGDVSGRYVHFTGNTSTNGVDPHFAAAPFQAVDPVCNPVSGMSDDQVIDFHLSERTRLRVETMGTGTTEGAGFEHVIALMERSAGVLPIQHDLRTPPADNDDEASAHEIDEAEVLGLGEGGVVQFLGSAQNLSADYSQADMGGAAAGACNNGNAGANSALRDAVFRFQVTQTESDGSPISFDFDTLPLDPATGYKTWLSVHRERVKVEYAVTLNPDNYDAESSAVALPNASTSLEQRRVVASSGTVNTAPNTGFIPTSVMGCGASGGAFPNGGRDAVFRFTLASATSVNLRTTATNNVNTAPAFNSYMAVFKDSISAANRQTPDGCVDPAGNAFAITNLALSAGTYYVVVKQWTGSTNGGQQAFGLVIEDANLTPALVDCDAGSHPNSGNYSKLSLPLAPGNYYVVVKGPASGAAPWNYQLNVGKTPPPVELLACDYESRGNRRGFLERELEAGDYSVIIRGLTDTDRGGYALALRDMDAVPDPLACYNTRGAGAGGASAITASLAAGVDYVLVTRGNQNNHSGNYTLVIEDVDERPVACGRNNAFSVGYDSQLIYNGEVTQVFQPGDYLAILKGYNTSDSATNTDDDDKGMYQITFGDRSLQQSGVFAAENWLGPHGNGFGGIRQELLSRGVRVITVASTTGTNHGANAATHEQLRALSQATGALDVSNAPLMFPINRDGSGMGRAVVDAVNLLAGNLAMDLSVRLTEAPDDPEPNDFRFSAEAIDVVGDLCDAPIDRDGDALHLPDTHVQCKPGAVPRFEIKITNPAPPFHVQPNPLDPQGGYNMTLELIGDDTFVVDQIPVYVIPQDVVPEAPEEIFEQKGTYETVSGSAGCLSTDAPDWSALAWNATVPSGTKLTFRVCAANSTAGLENCSYRLAAEVVSGGACSSDSQCSNGYCHVDSGICHYVTGPSCGADSDCGSGGQCVGSVCTWRDNQVDLHPAVRAGWNGRRFMKVQMELQSNSTRTRAPTVHDWKLDYLCSGAQ